MAQRQAYNRVPSPGHGPIRIAGTRHEATWRSLIGQVTWMVCRKFQFQAFNYVDKDGKGTLDVGAAEKFTPATAFLVADHLSQLLITDGMPREECNNPARGFGNALWRLHYTVFSPYEDWAKHERFIPFAYHHFRNEKTDSPMAILGGLLDLCTYFCLWTEASSLRHMPESLWFFYWTMQQSRNFEQLQAFVQQRAAKLWELTMSGTLASFSERRCNLRFQYRKQFNQYWKDHGKEPRNILDDQTPYPALDDLMLGLTAVGDRRVIGTAVRHVEWSQIGNGFGDPSMTDRNKALMCDLVLFGDGGEFMNRIITPVFRALAYEVSTKGGKGVEPAMRITYDDANESFVLPPNVRRIIESVAGKLNLKQRSPDIFHKFWVLGDRSGNRWDADVARAWYDGGGPKKRDSPTSNKLPWLLKTFQERRTWFATYLAYFRIFAFHICWFHALLALSFLYDDTRTLTCVEEEFDEDGLLIAVERTACLPGEPCLNDAGDVCPIGQRIENGNWWDRSALKDANDPASDNPWRHWWMGLSTVVITHAVLQLIYAYGVLYIRLKVSAPPAGQHDMRKQVKKNQSYLGAALSLLCCCLPRRVASLGGLFDDRGLTKQEEDDTSTNALWQVSHATKVSMAVAGVGRAFINLVLWLLVTIGLAGLFIAQFKWTSLSTIKVTEDRVLESLWGTVAGAYAGFALLLWLITMRDGYTVTVDSVLSGMSRCFGFVGGSGSRNLLGSEYMGAQQPKVGVSQFMRNVLFWTFVIIIKFYVDFWLIMTSLPKAIRGLRGQEWLETCGSSDVNADGTMKDGLLYRTIGNTNIPCVGNLVLIGALCFPVFLVVQFDTGIFYQIGVFMYGCLNGLLVLGLGQVVTWNDLVKQFEKGVTQFNKKLLSPQAETTWRDGRKVMDYYQEVMRLQQEQQEQQEKDQEMLRQERGEQVPDGSKAPKQASQPVQLPDLISLDHHERRDDYRKWTPFADVWDGIVQDLRLSDLISTAEEVNLKFHSFHFLHDHHLKPHVLPVCFFAGKIQRALDDGSTDGSSTEVLQQAYYLFLALLTEVGVLRPGEQQKLHKIELVNQPQNYYHTNMNTEMSFIESVVTSSLAWCGHNFMALMVLPHNVHVATKIRVSSTSYKGVRGPTHPEQLFHGVRKSMVNKIKEVITILSEFKPSNGKKKESAETKKEEMTKKVNKLASAIEGLVQNVLIELKYSFKILPSRGQVATQEATLKDLLDARQPGCGLVQEPEGSKLRLNEKSRLARYLHAMCADPGQENDLQVTVQEVSYMLELLKKAMTLTDQEAEPKNEEASRVLKFFMSTLLSGSMKRPQPLDQLRSLTTLVPHYAEGVLYPLDNDEVQERVDHPVEGGKLGDELVSMMKGLDVSTIDFLRIQFKDEWDNFVERMVKKYDVEKVMEQQRILQEDITERHFLKKTGSIFSKYPTARMDLMIWASERGQMLSRTVKGMMMYGRALYQLEYLETMDKRNGMLDHVVNAKFRHIVASQVYGEKLQKKEKKKNDWLADQWLTKSIQFLMQSYPSMRIAYIDNVNENAGGQGTPMAVLLRWQSDQVKTEPGQVVEEYRVRLPTQWEDKRGVILGEGKPENQNAAMIFCFGECIQTVDMNQENHLAEAYKMRNLLQEFSPKPKAEAKLSGGISVNECRKAVRAAAEKEPITALVGFREWIFSGKAGMLGQFAAGAEFAFGTIVQRTMAEPGGARFHYGHPDVWNKLFTMTRGGVSKATRAFHISEDVFGGYNAIFRGAVIKYKEFISVGKARDVGFAQINGFEAKVSGGNGEQSISRDVHRLGTRLDWFRLMSWYHSGIGFFINSTLTMGSVYISVWLVLFFSLTKSLVVQDLVDEAALTSTLSTVQLFQLGLLSIIPFWGELCLETGFLEGTMNIVRQTIAGALLFFIFRQQTSAHYFTQIAYYGGAKYIATGRGFDLKHTPYVQQFSSFGRSHIYFGFQLALIAIMLAVLRLPDYRMSTWGAWLVAVALTFSPFWFNPATFRTDVVQRDFDAWRTWLAGSRDPNTKESWTTFHRSQMEKARNVEGKQTDHGWNRLGGVGMQTFNVVILVALGYRIMKVEEDAADRDATYERKLTGLIFFELAIAAIVLMTAVASMVKAKGANIRRYMSIVAFALLAGLITYYVVRFNDKIDRTGGFSDFVLLAYANMTLMIVVVQICLYVFPYERWAMQVVDFGYYAADVAIGLVLFAVLFLLSVVQLVDSLQALLLFSSELLIESRRGAQVRLFDRRFGDLSVNSGASSSKGGAPPPETIPGTSPGAGPSSGAPKQSSEAPPKVRQRVSRYGTVGAQQTISDSRPLRQSLWQDRTAAGSPSDFLYPPQHFNP